MGTKTDNKREFGDLSFSSSPDIEPTKKSKIIPKDVAPIYISNIDKSYANNPKKLKDDLDLNFPNINISDLKVTAKGDLIISVSDVNEMIAIMKSQTLFKTTKRPFKINQ